MRAKFAVFAAVVVAALAGAAPAFAHEEINPKQFPTGTPTFFTLTAANEQKVDLTKVTLTAPSGVNFGETTRSPQGWTANASGTVITWTGGAVKPNQFDSWGYEIDSADQPGTLTYKVTLGYADGKTDDVNVQTTAVATATATATTIAGGGGAATTAPSGTTPTTASAKSGAGSSARSRANIALVLGIIAIVASLVALGLAASRRRAPTSAPTAVGGAGGAGGSQKQDW